MTGLSDWHYQASAQAAAGENCHDAEVKEHSSPGVHVLRARDACI